MTADFLSMTETEATLVVVSERPEELLSEIESFTSIGPYTLVPGPTLKIEDHYLDTADGALARGKWALRIRSLGSETRIALKGPSLATDWGGVERLEMDLPWNPESASKVFSELAGHLPSVVLSGYLRFSDQPWKTLKQAGLQVIQHRRTTRRPRDVLTVETHSVSAELALDSVVYSFAQREILHFELEIETRDPGDAHAITMILELLTSLYGSELLLWPYSKLATGLAIETLLQQSRLGELLQEGVLTRAAYEIIGEYLNNNA